MKPLFRRRSTGFAGPLHGGRLRAPGLDSRRFTAIDADSGTPGDECLDEITVAVDASTVAQAREQIGERGDELEDAVWSSAR
jgi:hypothetical protein